MSNAKTLLETLWPGLPEAALAAATEEPTELTSTAIARFEAALFEAHATRTERGPTWDRYRANLLLRACIELISSNPTWHELKFEAPLAELSAALNDLERGFVAPMLKPKRLNRGGRPASFYNAAVRAHAAAIMGGLMEHAGMPQHKSAEWVAERLRWHNVTWKTITAWRKEARELPGSDVGQRYDLTLKRTDWNDPLECALRLVSNLQSLAPPEK